MTGSISIEFHNIGLKLYDMANSISIFGFEITYYGIIIGIGMLLGIVLVCREAKRTGQNPDDYLDFALYAIVLSVMGARLYYVIFRWDYYKNHLSEIINLRKGGLAIYGGIIVAVLTCFVYTRIRKMSFKKMADTACIGLIAGQIIGRWGNFFNREAYGTVTGNSNPFAMRIYFDDWYSVFDVPSKVITSMESKFGKAVEEIGYVQVHPTFLYESLWNLAVLIIILIFRRYKKYDGEVILWYLLGYALGRAWIEGLRTDQLIMPVINCPVSQLLSIVVIIVVSAILIYKRVSLKKENKKTKNVL